MKASNLQTFKRANLNLVAMSEIDQGDVIVFHDHHDKEKTDRLGVVYKVIEDKAGQYNGIATSAVVLPLTPVSRQEYDSCDREYQSQIFGERRGIRILLKPNETQLRALSVNPSMYYTLGYNVQLPGHKELPEKDKLRILSVTTETLMIGEGRTVQKLGSCEDMLSGSIEDAMNATFRNKSKASSLLHAIKEKSQLTRDVLGRRVKESLNLKR